MKYNHSNQNIPQESRKEVNDKILYIIDNKLCDKYNITQEDIFNAYTGEGGLHGLEFNEFESFHSYTEAKKEIENGQFFTSHQVSKFLVDCIKPSKHDLIVDLTSGMGNFFNYLPNELNAYGNELDMKAYKVSKHLYPKATITNQDIRNFKTDIKYDLVLGNPPFNLRWKVKGTDYVSQLFYCIKAHEVLKPGGLMAIIVPVSFLNDSFKDSGMIKEIDKMFNFIGQFELPSDSFRHVGVEAFPTKMMFFQKKSKYIEENPYQLTYISSPSFDSTGSDSFYNFFISPVISERQGLKHKMMMESASEGQKDGEFNYKVKKYLFDIKRNPKINQYFGKCEQYVERYYTQEMPKEMSYEEWQKVRLTKNKVIRYLKNTLNRQHKNEIDKTVLVKTRYGLKLKPYSRKEQILLSKSNMVKSASFTDMVIQNVYPFSDTSYLPLFNKKRKMYEKQNANFSELKEDSQIKSYLDDLIIKDYENNEEIQLNDIQKEDTTRILMKDYGYLQWGTGSGKSISAIAQIKYRLKHNNINNVFVVAPAIAINNNWEDILRDYKMDFIRIEKKKDIEKIKTGQIVIMTLGITTKFQREIKKYIKKQSQKIMFVLDEADAISNPSSKRTKAILNCFRRVKYKTLMSATSTRNNIAESFTAFELLYNNSFNMICTPITIYEEDKKDKVITDQENKHYMQPFPPYRRGHSLFKKCFSPEKATVFGVGKINQDVYNGDELSELINKTMITRTFAEVSGKDIYEIIQDTCVFNNDELGLYEIVVKEFHLLAESYDSTGNTQKDALLKIIQQLNCLLKACVIPNTFDEYNSNALPSKAVKVINMIESWKQEQVVIGCTHVKTVEMYSEIIKEHFPDRPLFIITGDSTSLNKRKKIIKELKDTPNGILICTQQSLSSSMNIDFVNKVILIELQWNFASMHQFFARFVRYTSTEQKEIHFLTIENSIESNLLKLIMNKEKLNNFMKSDSVDDEELYERFGVDFDILKMLLTKEVDSDGKSYISWGNQTIHSSDTKLNETRVTPFDEAKDTSIKEIDIDSTKEVKDTPIKEIDIDSTKEVKDTPSKEVENTLEIETNDNSEKEVKDISTKDIDIDSTKEVKDTSSKGAENTVEIETKNNSEEVMDTSTKEIEVHSTKEAKDTSSKEVENTLEIETNDNSEVVMDTSTKEMENHSTKEVKITSSKEAENTLEIETENNSKIEVKDTLTKEMEIHSTKEVKETSSKEAESTLEIETKNKSTIEVKDTLTKETEIHSTKEVKNTSFKEAEKALKIETKNNSEEAKDTSIKEIEIHSTKEVKATSSKEAENTTEIETKNKSKKEVKNTSKKETKYTHTQLSLDFVI